MEACAVTRSALLRAAGALAACTIAQPASAADPTTLKITLPSVGAAAAPYYVAVQKGYLAAEGLVFDFSFTGGGIATPALISGTVQGSASGSAALSAILRGAALRVVAVFCDTPTYGLWVRSDITSLAALKGKNVGVATRGDTFEVSTRLALQAAGMSGDDVGYTPFGAGTGAGAAFATGSIPAVVLSSRQSEVLREKGMMKNARMLLDYHGKVMMPWNAFALAEPFITAQPGVVHRMMRAIVKGARYTRANRAQTIVMVDKYGPIGGEAATAADYDDMVTTFSPTLTIPDAFAVRDFAVRAALENIPPDRIPPIGNAYDFSAVRAVNAELDKARWKPTP